MADSGDEEFPSWQSYQNYPLFTDDILSFMAAIRPTRAELMAKAEAEGPSPSSNPVPPPQPPSIDTIGEGGSGTAIPMEAYSITQMESYTETNVDWSSTAGPSSYFPGETSRQEQDHSKAQNPGQGGAGGDGGGFSRQLSIIPETLTVPPITCSCCLVLREIVHTNGFNTRRLEIHGRFGMFCHAILQEYFIGVGNLNSSSSQYEMFDFARKSIDEVKLFILQYYLNQMLDNYTALPEPLSDFYDILCIGMDLEDQSAMSPDNRPQPVSLNPEDEEDNEEGEGEEDEDQMQMEQQPEIHEGRRRPLQTPLARQRQRAGRMTVNDLKDYLHLPISEAAKKMNLCLTVVKKICRRSGLRRWPYRKVKSYQRKMGALGTRLRSRDAETRARAEAEMERLRQELAQFCAGIAPN